MCDDIAYVWITADDQNRSRDIDRWIADGATAESFASECIEGWDLNAEWLEKREIDRGDIVAAFQRFIDTRPDRSREAELAAPGQ